jgi:DNA-binding GntR family transcriptional regulator
MSTIATLDGPRRQLDGTDSVAHQLRSELLRAIISLEMKPGTRISEVEIAQRYGVSRQPVREAVISLAQTGLLKTIPQRGTIVVPISVRQMLDARFVREAIEVAVARQASQSISLQARRQLDNTVTQQEMAVANDDRQAFFRFDEAFHTALCQGAGSQTAWESIRNVKVHMDRVCSLTLKNAGAMAPLIEEHKAILEAVDAHDADAAARAMSLHLHGILSSLPQVEAAFPEYFE